MKNLGKNIFLCFLLFCVTFIFSALFYQKSENEQKERLAKRYENVVVEKLNTDGIFVKSLNTRKTYSISAESGKVLLLDLKNCRQRGFSVGDTLLKVNL